MRGFMVQCRQFQRKGADMTKKIAFVAVTMFAGAAFAGTITETTTDMTALGDWTVNVASGDSNVVTVAQSGTGKIIKTGGGYLVLRKNSTFTGGVELQAGFIMVDPDADAGTSGTVNCTALGTGDVTILGQRSGYTGYCELGIVGAGKDDTRIVTVANNINVTGTSNGTYPALVIYGQNSVLTGKITAAADFYFWDDFSSTTAISSSQWNRLTKVQSCTFGEIEAAGTIGFNGWCRFVMAGKVKTPKFDLTITRTRRSYDGDTANGNGNAHGAFVFKVPCEIGELIDNRRHIYCAAANVLPGTLFRHTEVNAGYSYNHFKMFGYSPATAYAQTIGGLASDPLGDTQKWNNNSTEYEWWVQGAGGKTLTITGVAPEDGESERELVTCASLNESLKVEVNAYDGFTQTVSNRTHTMTGTLTVKKGAFRMAGLAKFPNLTGITVDQGARFDFFTGASNAVKALTSLTVNGTFTMSAAAVVSGAFDTGSPTLPRLNLAIGANGSLSLPQGTTLNVWRLTVGGVAKTVGTYTHADLPQLPEGVIIIVRSVVQGAAGVWTGAAEADNLMATIGNWQGTPESLPLGDYTLGVTVNGDGEEMVYADGTKINNIMFRRTPASTPFTIRPATPGASLEISGRFEVTNAAQLIIKDAIITTPNHEDQGEASVDAQTVICFRLFPNDSVIECAESNNVYKASDGKCLPLVLDNAIIEKPFYSIGASMSGYQYLYAMPGSTNEFKGDVYHASWWPYINVGANAMLTFSGGLRASILMRKMGAGTMVVKNKPFTSTSYFGVSVGKLVLDVENCTLLGSTSGEGLILERDKGAGELEFRRSYCFNGGAALIIPYSNSNVGLVEFAATTQRVTRLHGNASSANVKMHGDPGALLEVVGGRNNMEWATYKMLTNRVDLTGALSFRLSATNETMTFYSKAFSTCGDLEVSAGTLDFRSDASWLNGTNIAVNGEGRLKIGKSNTFNKDFAELSLADAGVFEVPTGKSQTFNYATTNGIVLPSGHYTSLPNGEGDFLAGGGEIVVRRHGVVFSIR